MARSEASLPPHFYEGRPCENRGSNLNPEIATLPAVTRNDISAFLFFLLALVGTVHRASAMV